MEDKNAVTLVKEKGGLSDSKALMDFAKKDVSELKAINKVAEKLGDSGLLLLLFQMALTKLCNLIMHSVQET